MDNHSEETSHNLSDLGLPVPEVFFVRYNT